MLIADLVKSAPSKIPGTGLALHLGCGRVRIPRFINVDILPHAAAVDEVDDIRRLERFQDGSALVIYACHVLEHVETAQVLPVLRRWHEVLLPGGELRISVPDLDRIVRIYMANWEHFQTPGLSPWVGLIFGGQEDPHDFHKTGFNGCWMRHLLEEAGFVEISEYPHEPHWLGIEDASLAKEPFGEFLSLNIRARKPA